MTAAIDDHCPFFILGYCQAVIEAVIVLIGVCRLSGGDFGNLYVGNGSIV